MPAPVNYTTKIAASKTAAEIQDVLAKYGARHVMLEYSDGYPTALGFSLETSVGMRTFLLPVNIDKMHTLLLRKGRARQLGSMPKSQWQSHEHAARIAWRVLKDWLVAQLAMIDTEMVDLEVVMLPYLRIDENRTLYQAWATGERLALEASNAGA